MAGKNPKARLCSARAKSTGKKCTRPAIPGGSVCRFHGGAAPQVKRAAENRLRKYVEEMVDPDRVLAEIARVAMSDPTALYDRMGKLRPMTEWTEEARAAVASLEIVKRNLASGDGETDEILKIKVWDKPKCLEMLAKHLQLYEEKVSHSGGIELVWRKSE